MNKRPLGQQKTNMFLKNQAQKQQTEILNKLMDKSQKCLDTHRSVTTLTHPERVKRHSDRRCKKNRLKERAPPKGTTWQQNKPRPKVSDRKRIWKHQVHGKEADCSAASQIHKFDTLKKHNAAAEYPWVTSGAIRHGGREHKTAAWGATHRVVAPAYGRLPGGVRIHGVDDRLPLSFLVDLSEAPPGLSVRSLSLEVFLIFIHIVHLEAARGGVTVSLHSHTAPSSSLPPLSLHKKWK